MKGDRRSGEPGSNWKISNTSDAYWRKMIQYYKWLFTLLILAFSVVLLIECQFVAGISLMIIAVFLTPFKPIRSAVDRLQPVCIKVIILLCATTFIVSIVVTINSMAL